MYIDHEAVTRLLEVEYAHRGDKEPISARDINSWVHMLKYQVDGMDERWAKDAIRAHYEDPEAKPMRASHLLDKWRKQLRSNASTESKDSHCGQPHCNCAHDQCYRGWIDGPPGSTTTTPCKYCRTKLEALVVTLPPPGDRSLADLRRFQIER